MTSSHPQREESLSARRAWIEIVIRIDKIPYQRVALRKESVDRNSTGSANFRACTVALRKESVDRNSWNNRKIKQSN